MKTLSALSMITLGFAVSSASAADLPSAKAPVAFVEPAPAFTWTGVYAGLNIGYGWSEKQSIAGTVSAAGTPIAFWSFPSSAVDGVLGGGQIGYNRQFAGTSFVVGLEADFRGAGVNGYSNGFGPTNQFGYTPFVNARQQLDWFGTVRGRLGYAVAPTLLVYGTGGFAYGGYRATYSGGAVGVPVTVSVSNSDVRTGWTAGGGVEWAFLPRWSAKVEYLYTELERGHDASYALLGLVANQVGVQNRFHTISAGVNYHFDLFGAPPAPVVARY
ncbi:MULTISPECIES: outer membrane protein [Methylosinus]|uniref:Porin family protein n=1 Tax=Methylosinus trichosporium (strain ATCC 35070 / NCIMB 11131 / UNIQEM 75 / OB3b) TaxID=595536 RepID=A0A2D2D3Z8_METT3|nr:MULTISPECIES: outer membrane protein [Methylosinus]ATQ69713.1 porin family protein [Methylosinus trichosporium OB3b]OBS51203.1 flagellar motor protein MotB [Methylosinus sp. 3S-1]